MISLLKKQFSSVEEIHEGFSKDRKFICDDLFVRVFPFELRESRQRTYSIQEAISKLNLPCAQCIAYQELSADFDMIIETNIKGCNAASVIAEFSIKEQFELGQQAAIYQQMIHQLKAPFPYDPHQMKDKIKRHQSKVTLNEVADPQLYQYHKKVLEHLHLFENRPLVLQHGDYHLANFMINQNKELVIVDFNRSDYSDPIEDYLACVNFSKEVSLPFAKGQLTQANLSSKDYQMLHYYLYDIMTFSIVWANLYEIDKGEQMRLRMHRILHDFNQFNSLQPTWL